MSSPVSKTSKPLKNTKLNNAGDSAETSNSPLVSDKAVVAGNLPPRKRARTDAEKEQRRVERILRNRKAAHASREKKRKHVAKLESYVKLLESNVKELFLNQSLLSSKLSENKIVVDFPIIAKVQRPSDLLLSDEEQNSDHNNNDHSNDVEEEELEEDEEDEKMEEKTEEKVKDQIESIFHGEESISKRVKLDSSVDVSPDLLPTDPSFDSQLGLNLDFPVDELSSLSPSLYSSSSSPLNYNDLSLPTTPIKNYYDNKNLDNIMEISLDNSGDFMNSNTFEPDFILLNPMSNSDSINFDADSIDLKDDDSKMGFFGLFNSVHSAVVH